MIKGRVLLLNQSFEVLGTIGIARAIRMTLRQENPVIVHEYVPDVFLTSAGGQKFPVPSVISLKHYVNVIKKRQQSGAKRLKIYLRDRYRCQYCSVKASVKPNSKQIHVKELTLDHITPRSKGGENVPENLVTACIKCNQRKADRTPQEANMPLVTQTHETQHIGLDKLLICSYLEKNPSWAPYLIGQDGFDEALAMVANG